MLVVVLTVLVGACAKSSTTTTTKAADPPPAEPKEPPPAEEQVSTSSTTKPAPTSTVPKGPTKREQVDEIKEKTVDPDYVEGGILGPNGAFLEFSETINPFPGVALHAFVDEDGRVHIYMEGLPDELIHLWVEFDAVEGARTVTQETSLVGIAEDQMDDPKPDAAGDGPEWVEPTPKGSTAKVEDNPPPEAAEDSPIGLLIPTDITTLEEWARISIWIYSGFHNGVYDFAHYQILREQIVENSSDGVIVAALFTGLLNPNQNELDPLIWINFAE